MTNTTELTDLEFVHAFEACELANDNFHHRDHIRLAWIYLRRHPQLEAQRHMAAEIRKFAAQHGKSGKYHETITVAWLRLVANAMSRVSVDSSFEDLTAVAPELLDKRTMDKFYSAAALSAEAARMHWVEPDLQPLP